jgi:hypothetical protein
VPIKILYNKLASGRFVEAQESNSSSSPSCGSSMLRKTSIPLRPFKTTETAISKYIRDDEDSDTFISLFAPLMQTDLSLESTLCVYIERYSTPPGEHERSLTIVLSMAERWLFQRARHEVSLIPGNYRASLLQFDSQDMGEVSQNLTYNFRHREQTLLPELKNLLTFLWRSTIPSLQSFRKRLNENDPYFVVQLLASFFHEQTISVYEHPAIIRYTLSRFFRKSVGDNPLKMMNAGQNASLAASMLSLMRSVVCSLICSFRSNFNVLAYQAVRQSQLCRTSNILSPMIRRLRELERRKKRREW